MKLAAYLSAEKITYGSFAAEMGVSYWTVAKWARGERTPALSMIRKIKAATNGAVTADDFGDVEPADRQVAV